MCCTTARRVHREDISSLGYRHVESEHYAVAHDGVAVTRWESRRRALGACDSAQAGSIRAPLSCQIRNDKLRCKRRHRLATTGGGARCISLGPERIDLTFRKVRCVRTRIVGEITARSRLQRFLFLWQAELHPLRHEDRSQVLAPRPMTSVGSMQSRVTASSRHSPPSSPPRCTAA